MLILTIGIVSLFVFSAVSATDNATDDVVGVTYNETDAISLETTDSTVNINEAQCGAVNIGDDDNLMESDFDLKLELNNEESILTDWRDGSEEEITEVTHGEYGTLYTHGKNYEFEVFYGIHTTIYADGSIDKENAVGFSELPTSFVHGSNLYSLRETTAENGWDYYYEIHPLSFSYGSYTVKIDYAREENGYMSGYSGDTRTVFITVTDSNGNPADGYVVVGDVSQYSSPMYLINGRAKCEYTLKYTGNNGGFFEVYYYKSSNSGVVAKGYVKYIGLKTTYVLESDMPVCYYTKGNSVVTFNISVYNKDQPWKQINSVYIQYTNEPHVWTNIANSVKEAKWNYTEKRATVSFTVNVAGLKYVGFRLKPGSFISCNDYYIPIKFMESPIIGANIAREGNNINVDLSFVDKNKIPIAHGEVTINIASINKTFSYNISSSKLNFSFANEDYFFDKFTTFEVSYHDDTHLVADGYEEFKFIDDIYFNDIIISNLSFEQYQTLTPIVKITNTSFDKEGYVALCIGNKKYIENVKNGVAKFNIQLGVPVGNHSITFEYYYDSNHLILSKESILNSKPSTEGDLILVVNNNWVRGENLKPEIKVIYKGDTKHDGYLARWVTTSEVSHYLNGEPVYKRVLDEHSLENGYAVFDLGDYQSATYVTEEFYYYTDKYSNAAIKKSITFRPDRLAVELIGPTMINVGVNETVTFIISIVDYHNLLEKIPMMKKSDSYYKPFVKHDDTSATFGMVKEVNYDLSNGIYSFSYTPTLNTHSLRFYISSLYISGEIIIPVNIKTLDPILELSNNGTIGLLDMNVGFKLSNWPYIGGTIIIETDEGESNFDKRSGDMVYYTLPFKTIGEKKVKVLYYPTIYMPFNCLEKEFTLNIVKQTPNFKFYKNGDINQTIPIKIKVGDTSGILPTGNAILTFNNNELPIKINNNIIQLNLPLPSKPGNYSVKFNYTGDDKFGSRVLTFKIEVPKQNITLISSDSIIINPNENFVLSLSALSEFNKNANIGSVNVKLGSKVVVCSVVNNIINIPIPQKIDFDNILINFTGDDYYNSASKTIKVIKAINGVEVPQLITNKDLLSFNLPSDAKGIVKIEIAGYSFKSTISNGNVKFNLSKIGAGNYNYVISYDGDNNYGSFTKYGALTIKLVVDNVIVPLEFNSISDKSIRISLPYDAGGTIILTINNVEYASDVTNGVANVKLPELANGNYEYIITYSGDTKYTSFTKTGSLTVKKQTTPTNTNNPNTQQFSPTPTTPVVKITITLKTVKVKKSAKKLILQATLKQGKKALSGKKVTFKFNGKTYKAKTNKKGIAKVTIKKKVLKKLKVGKKVKYQASYGKVTAKKTVKIKK